MTEIQHLRSALRQTLEGDAWHGPGLRELLDTVTAPMAAARPIPGAHSIWELVLHLRAWVTAMRGRIEGVRVRLSDEENFPAVTDTSEEAWSEARRTLEEEHALLVEAMGRMDDADLDSPLLEGMSSRYHQLQGVVGHCVYHAGQIAILKRALEAGC